MVQSHIIPNYTSFLSPVLMTPMHISIALPCRASAIR